MFPFLGTHSIRPVTSPFHVTILQKSSVGPSRLINILRIREKRVFFYPSFLYLFGPGLQQFLIYVSFRLHLQINSILSSHTQSSASSSSPLSWLTASPSLTSYCTANCSLRALLSFYKFLVLLPHFSHNFLRPLPLLMWYIELPAHSSRLQTLFPFFFHLILVSQPPKNGFSFY